MSRAVIALAGVVLALSTGGGGYLWGHAAGKAAEVMRSSRELAQQTVQQTGQAEQALNQIRSEVTAINSMNAQIAGASEEQSAVAEEVNQNINRIHRATLETAAGSEQVAVASRELTTLANRLTERVSFFRL